MNKYIKYGALVLAFVFLLGIAFFIWIIINPIKYAGFPTVRETTLAIATLSTVFATLILAFATFNIVDSSNEQEKQRYKRELAREDRERKERLLTEMKNWVYNLNFKILSLRSEIYEGNEGNLDKPNATTIYWKQEERLETENTNSSYFVLVAKEFNTSLENAISMLNLGLENLRLKTHELGKLVMDRSMIKEPEQRDIKTKEIEEFFTRNLDDEQSLIKLINNISQEIAKAKIALIKPEKETTNNPPASQS